MALRNPASDLVTFLDGKTAGGVALAKASNLFAGPMRTTDVTPSPAVFLLNTGGPPPAPYLGGNRESYFRATVQVLVRGPAGDIEAGEALARGVYELLHLATVTGYVALFARDSQPAYLGEDADQHGLWSLNVECQYKATAA